MPNQDRARDPLRSADFQGDPMGADRDWLSGKMRKIPGAQLTVKSSAAVVAGGFRFLIYRSAADFLRLRKRLVLWLFRLFNTIAAASASAIEPQSNRNCFPVHRPSGHRNLNRTRTGACLRLVAIQIRVRCECEVSARYFYFSPLWLTVTCAKLVFPTDEYRYIWVYKRQVHRKQWYYDFNYIRGCIKL